MHIKATSPHPFLYLYCQYYHSTNVELICQASHEELLERPSESSSFPAAVGLYSHNLFHKDIGDMP